MNYSKYRFNLDMQSYISQISLPVRQHDTGIVLRINLTDGGVPYVIKDGCRAVFYARKADGNPLMNDCVIEKNTTICYELTQQTTACSGVVDCEIRLYGTDGNLITTPRFILVVDSRVVHDDDFPVSDSEQTILDNIILNETARQANEVEREKAETERESAEAERAKVFNEAEAEREEAFDEALETAERAQDIANTLTKKLEAGEFLGKSVFIRYSDNADGTDYTEEWNGEFYIGIAVAVTAPTDKSEYNWTRFYGDPVSFNELTDVPYSYLDVDEYGYLCLSEDKTIGSPMGFVGQIASNALKGNVSGSAVAMKDVSPLEHELDVKVSSKNLFELKLENFNSQNIELTDSGFTVSGSFIAYNFKDFVMGETYFISGVGGITAVEAVDAVGNILRGWYNIEITQGVAFTVPNGAVYMRIYFYGADGGAYSNIQIKKGTEAAPYAPYLDNISTAEVKRYGKNLLPTFDAVVTADGVTATFKDGYVTFTGALAEGVNSVMLYYLYPAEDRLYLPSGKYVMGGFNPSTNVYVSGYSSLEDDRKWVGDIYTSGMEMKNAFYLQTLVVYVTAECIGKTFPLIMKSGTTMFNASDEFEPYIEPTTYAVEADGSVNGVMPLYPSTTLITDNRAIIECEYNRDINKAFEELTQIILSLGGNI